MLAATGEKPGARPLFRKLALGMAVVCFVLPAGFAIAPVENKLMGAGLCLFVGLVMLTIAKMGFWPPRSSR